MKNNICQSLIDNKIAYLGRWKGKKKEKVLSDTNDKSTNRTNAQNNYKFKSTNIQIKFKIRNLKFKIELWI